MLSNGKIETISEEEIKSAIASFDPQKHYVKNSYIDMYDVNVWRVGIITAAENDRIDVHFDGWASKYDEKNVKVTEVRVAPFRRFTKGYTGQPKNTYRAFTYKEDVRRKMEKRVRRLLDNKFEVEDANRFNQFFRGDLFFFVDSLLTSLGAAPPAAELVPEIVKFLELYLQAVVEWMKLAWDLEEELEAAEKWEFLYAVHGRTSLALAHSDLAENLCKLFGGSIRAHASFLTIYFNRDGVYSDEFADIKEATEWIVNRFYKKFKELGGLDEIFKMVKE